MKLVTTCLVIVKRQKAVSLRLRNLLNKSEFRNSRVLLFTRWILGARLELELSYGD